MFLGDSILTKSRTFPVQAMHHLSEVAPGTCIVQTAAIQLYRLPQVLWVIFWMHEGLSIGLSECLINRLVFFWMGLKLGSNVNCPFNEFHEVVSCTIDAKRFREKNHVDSVAFAPSILNILNHWLPVNNVGFTTIYADFVGWIPKWIPFKGSHEA